MLLLSCNQFANLLDQLVLGTLGVAVVLGDDVPRSGVSSTIVDCTHEHPHILRVGALTADDFKELL
mgnify:CR=1 FL=1